MNIFALESVLKGLNIKCDTAMTGNQAIELFKQRISAYREQGVPLYKVFLVDYSMPGMSGPEMAEQICELSKIQDIEAPYMCCCTAYSDAVFRNTALSSGMQNFMTKPVSA